MHIRNRKMLYPLRLHNRGCAGRLREIREALENMKPQRGHCIPHFPCCGFYFLAWAAQSRFRGFGFAASLSGLCLRGFSLAACSMVGLVLDLRLQLRKNNKNGCCSERENGDANNTRNATRSFEEQQQPSYGITHGSHDDHFRIVLNGRPEGKKNIDMSRTIGNNGGTNNCSSFHFYDAADSKHVALVFSALQIRLATLPF